MGRRTRDFRSCLRNAELTDLVFKGNNFTWWNKSRTRLVAKKLDRVLVNDKWCNFPVAYATFGEPDFSDHASCGVVLDVVDRSVLRPFKFYNYLLQNQSLKLLIKEQWYSINMVGSNMYRVSKKLQKLKA